MKPHVLSKRFGCGVHLFSLCGNATANNLIEARTLVVVYSLFAFPREFNKMYVLSMVATFLENLAARLNNSASSTTSRVQASMSQNMGEAFWLHNFGFVSKHRKLAPQGVLFCEIIDASVKSHTNS